MPSRFAVLRPLVAALALGACGSASSVNDAGTTAPVDTGSAVTDAGSGSPTDTGTSAVTDAGSPPSDAGAATALTGTLGTLGTVQPIVSAWVISNSGETLVYLSTAPLTCETLQNSRWLGTQPAGSQVVEIVMRGTPMPGQTVAVPPGEVNYAAGGRSSSYEVTARSGSITWTAASASGPVSGTVRATYASGSVMGTFQAEFCDHGQNY